MREDNKRPITTYTPSPTSKPVLQKKADAKNTPNKIHQAEIEQKQQEIHSANIKTATKQNNNPWSIKHGSSKWCAAKYKCLNSKEQASSRKKCANCLGVTHIECFGKHKKEFCITCEEENLQQSTHHVTQLGYGTSTWCAALEQCRTIKKQHLMHINVTDAI
jgi:hypothetical protein